jgi:hypothetical protein
MKKPYFHYKVTLQLANGKKDYVSEWGTSMENARKRARKILNGNGYTAKQVKVIDAKRYSQ